MIKPDYCSLIEDLAERGWSHQPLFVPAALVLELAAECRCRDQDGRLAQAAIGRGNAQEIHEGVRGDRIGWLDAGQCPAGDRYLKLLDGLCQALNRELFLGLEDVECHFAQYPPGAFYRRHRDCFKDDDSRVVSVVLYLNPDWQAQQGGALRLWPGAEEVREVLPAAGTLVAFMSAEVPHEVLPAQRERLSITGWLRRSNTRFL